MSFPNNPQDQDLVTIQGQEYRYVEAKDAWQKVLSNVPDLFDASTINGVSDLQFLRSDVADTMQGNLTLTGTLTATASTATIRTITVPETGSITVNGTAVTVIDDQGIVTDAAEIQDLTVNGSFLLQNTFNLSGADLVHTGGLISTPELLLGVGGSIVFPAEDSSTVGTLQYFSVGSAQLLEPGNLSTLNTVDALVDTVSSVDVGLIPAATIATGTGTGFTSELSASYVYEDWESGSISVSKWGSNTGVTNRENGTGTGTEGFGQSTEGSTRYLEWLSGSVRSLTSVSLNITDTNGVYPDAIFGIRYSVIIGSGSNGGATVTTGLSEGLNFGISTLGTGGPFAPAVNNGGTTSWATTTVNFLSTQVTETTALQWTQNNADGFLLDEIGLDNIEFLYRPTQEYYIQIGSKSLSRASSLRLNSASLFSVNTLTFRAIRGSGTNGEASPNITNSIALWYSIDGAAFVNFGSVTLTTSWADYSFNLTALGKSVTSDDTRTIVFELRNTNTSNRVFGVKSIAVNYDNPNFLRIRAPNKALISSAQIDLESNTINIGNSTSTGRVVLNSTASSSSVNATNSLFTNGGIYAAGIVRSAGGFFGSLSGSASSASFASSAGFAGTISNSSYDETFFTFTMNGTDYPSDSIYQYTIPITNSQTTYNSYEVTVVGYYYTPASTTSTLTARFYKHWHFGFHQFPATYVIEGAANIYSYNSDVTNFPAGAVGAGKAFASVVGNVLYLNLVQRTAAVTDSATRFSVKISRFIA
jgi:hypothetical protein